MRPHEILGEHRPNRCARRNPPSRGSTTRRWCARLRSSTASADWRTAERTGKRKPDPVRTRIVVAVTCGFAIAVAGGWTTGMRAQSHAATVATAACLAQRAHGRRSGRASAPAARAGAGDRDPRRRDRVQSTAGCLEHARRSSRVLESPRAARRRRAVGRLSLERLRRRGVERRGGGSVVRQAGSGHVTAPGDPDRREPRGVPRRARRDDAGRAGGTGASRRRSLRVLEPRRDRVRSIQPL